MESEDIKKQEHILIIDVDEEWTSLLTPLIDQLGYRCKVVDDPLEALVHLEDKTFTVVIAEVSLLRREQVMAFQHLHPEVCVLFTGQSMEELKELLDPRLSEFLTKPLSLEEAEFRLRRIILERDTRLRRHEAEEELEEARDELQRKTRELEQSEEDLNRIKFLYQEIGSQLNTTSEELLRAKEQLEILATTDGLTGVYNHRCFMDQIQETFKIAKDQAAPISLLLIDIDHFKAFNDNHGHMTGDHVLRSIAQRLKSSCKGKGIVARYGGEEFAIILDGTDSRRAERLATTIRKTVESHRVTNGSESLKVTISIGVGFEKEGVESVDHLISAADKALYRAKAAGRNRVACGERIQPPPAGQWFSRF
jgi:diguanylate cyclase (GGDEF)-like protein